MNDKKTVLVTGANKGIGEEVARQLGRLGMTVYVAARDEGRGKAATGGLRAAGIDARFVQLDVTDTGSIAVAARHIEVDAGRLDVLVNSAGISIRRPPPATLTVDDVRTIYGTNVFGVISVTQAMLPLLSRAPAGRIIMVSSGLGSLAKMSDPKNEYSRFSSLGYSTSKTALNAVTVAFANQLRATAITVNAVDPGHTKTDLNNNTGPGTVEQAARPVVRLATINGDGPTGGFFDEAGPVPW